MDNDYPRRVALAYGRDLRRAMADSDEAAAATVAEYEEGLGQERATPERRPSA